MIFGLLSARTHLCWLLEACCSCRPLRKYNTVRGSGEVGLAAAGDETESSQSCSSETTAFQGGCQKEKKRALFSSLSLLPMAKAESQTDDLISSNERSFIIGAISEQKRTDGRGLFDIRTVRLSFGSTWGRVQVQLGSTRYVWIASWIIHTLVC